MWKRWDPTALRSHLRDSYSTPIIHHASPCTKPHKGKKEKVVGGEGEEGRTWRGVPALLQGLLRTRSFRLPQLFAVGGQQSQGRPFFSKCGFLGNVAAHGVCGHLCN